MTIKVQGKNYVNWFGELIFDRANTRSQYVWYWLLVRARSVKSYQLVPKDLKYVLDIQTNFYFMVL